MSTLTATRSTPATSEASELLLEEFWAAVSSITAGSSAGGRRSAAAAGAPSLAVPDPLVTASGPGSVGPASTSSATAQRGLPPFASSAGLRRRQQQSSRSVARTPSREPSTSSVAGSRVSPPPVAPTRLAQSRLTAVRGVQSPRACAVAASRPPAPAAGRRAPAEIGSRTRLTARGRCVLVLAAALALLLAFSLGRSGSQAATSLDSAVRLQQTTVQAGETLWAVAARIAPKNDPRDVIAQIQRLNHLSSPTVLPGEQLVLPVAR